MNSFPILTILMLIPLVGGIFLTRVEREQDSIARKLALIFSFLALAMAALAWIKFDNASSEMQLVEKLSWVPALGIQYHLGIDGLGLAMILLSSIIIPFALLTVKTKQNAKLYFSLMLFLEAGLFGTFTALNFFHWFIFWELSLIPAFFLIKLWGGPKRTAAAYQFFVYTMVGSIAMLLAFIAIFSATGIFDFAQLAELARKRELSALLFAKLGGGLFKNESSLVTFIFLGVFLGFAVKVPLIPFHTWLPSAYAEAPTSTSMVLTGAMSKMGVYGFLRILLPIFPEQTRVVLTPLLWLAAATIVFSAFAALAQKDLKRLVAYSSINHLGYCLLGIFAAAQVSDATNEKAAALNGVILQMFNHGLTASALFYFVGLIEQRSAGLRGLNDFGGLRQTAPVFAGLMGITIFASLGLPGLNAFVGEFLIFKGAFPLASAAAAISTIGLLTTAVFLLTLIQRVFTGPLRQPQGWSDLTMSERFTIAPIVGLMFVLGIFPQILIGFVNPTVLKFVKHLNF